MLGVGGGNFWFLYDRLPARAYVKRLDHPSKVNFLPSKCCCVVHLRRRLHSLLFHCLAYSLHAFESCRLKMRFGRILESSIYKPWAANYVDYKKLKELLREDTPGSTDVWTDDDESAFVDELVNVQLEKVHSFQTETYQELRERCGQCEGKLESLVSSHTHNETSQKSPPGLGKVPDELLKEVLGELDGISKDINELEKYSRLCYTAFLKAAKKHDRRSDCMFASGGMTLTMVTGGARTTKYGHYFKFDSLSCRVL